MGTKGRRLAAVAALVVVAACGSGKDPGGVDSNDVRRPTPRSGSDTSTGEGEPPELTAVAPTLSVSGASATSEDRLLGVEHDTGDCLTWDEADDAATRVVDCAEPHRIQVTGGLAHPAPIFARYPSQADWVAYLERECGPLADSFLGRPLDPGGRYGPSWFVPTPETWANGSRKVTCGVGAKVPASTEPGRSVPFEGDVRDMADQGWDHAVGTCLDADDLPVGCDQPHLLEVVERFAYPDTPGPPDNAAVADVDRRCGDAVEAYMGGFVPSPWVHVLEEMDGVRWAAGSRHVHCLAGQVGADPSGWAEVTGPAPRG